VARPDRRPGIAGVTHTGRSDEGRAGAGSTAEASSTAEVEARSIADPSSVADAGTPADAGGVRELRGEPEPEWADAIRRGRRTRAERLRTVFASFDDEAATGVPGDERRERPQP
jgi:hypothetical protein